MKSQTRQQRKEPESLAYGQYYSAICCHHSISFMQGHNCSLPTFTSVCIDPTLHTIFPESYKRTQANLELTI